MISKAIRDLKQSFLQYEIWSHLGFQDVLQRYRRSFLGPWWITLSMMIFISVMGVVFSRIFAQNFSQYVYYFTSGFLLWSFISNCINESTDLFKNHAGFIKQVNLPYNLYVMKFFTKHLLIFAHNFIVYLLVIAVYKINPGMIVFLALPGLALLVLNLYWICLMIGLLSARFRDLVPIVNSSVQILFFVTPISWTPNLIGENSILLKLNPILHLIDIVRSPLLGVCPPLSIWIFAISFAFFGSIMCFMIFNKVRSKIPFWID